MSQDTCVNLTVRVEENLGIIFDGKGKLVSNRKKKKIY